MTIEYKNFEFKKSSLDEDGEYYYFEGYASTFGNEDSGKDVVVKGAFIDSLKSQTPKVLWQHNPNNPIGLCLSAKEDDEGLFVKAKLPKFVTLSNDAGGLIKCGAINSMSIGFTVNDYSIKDGVRYLKSLTLWEFSPVTFPMNSNAQITDIKGVTPFQDLPLAPRDTKWDGAAADKRIRKYADVEDAPNAKYKKAFMWVDSENDDKFGSYKLPYADVIDGKLQAIPQAIISIAGVLNGARGGTDIPDADQEKIKNIVKKYYSKMDMDAPFGKNDDIEMEEMLNAEGLIESFSCMKDIENFLKNPAPLSKNDRKILISKIKSFSGLRDVSKEVKVNIDSEIEGRDVSDALNPNSQVNKSVIDNLNLVIKLLSGENDVNRNARDKQQS
jgi:HK97 family phage prohead protease